MLTLSPTSLQRVTQGILAAAGTPSPIAGAVARILVGSNLAGHDSHGVLRIPTYLQMIQDGALRPAEEPQMLRERSATALVDGRKGWGHYTAEWATTLAVRKARAAGSCTLVLRRCNHIGRLGEYAEQATAAGCVGMIVVGAGGRGRGGAAPLGGAERALGTNPYAFGVPVESGDPFIIDFATTVVAEGKLQVARSKGLDVPEGLILDSEGVPSTRTSAFYEGGSMLFMGGHKGYAMSLFASLAAGLNGLFQPENWSLDGVLIQVLDPAAFLSPAEYRRTVSAFLEGIKSVRPATGSREILYPGEPEARSRALRREHGIEVPETIWDQLCEGAASLGLALELREETPHGQSAALTGGDRGD